MIDDRARESARIAERSFDFGGGDQRHCCPTRDEREASLGMLTPASVPPREGTEVANCDTLRDL